MAKSSSVGKAPRVEATEALETAGVVVVVEGTGESLEVVEKVEGGVVMAEGAEAEEEGCPV